MHADFPAVALIHNEIPKHPVRVYQGESVGVWWYREQGWQDWAEWRD
jgi:predicted ATP-grasp superfamily ATP-dependent carboligase